MSYDNSSDDGKDIYELRKSYFKTIKKKSEKNVVKRMLCKNSLSGGNCCYGSKCKYAHDLNDQIIDIGRKQAWDILLGNYDLSEIDLQKKYRLYQSLEELTKCCKQCCNNECIGGYNCDHGVYNKKYQICSQDLNYGNCLISQCELVHLTKRGLKPWFQNQPKLCGQIKGILLNENFFTSITNDDCCDEDVDMLSDFTNSDDDDNECDDECNQSIFMRQ